MLHITPPITDLNRIATNIFVLTFKAPELSALCEPGQFLNIKVHDLPFPLLRRPFSVYHVGNDSVKIIFNVVGAGTQILSSKKPGDMLDVIGPLGQSYSLDGDYDTALLVGGGLGVAPLPMVTSAIRGKRKILTFLGARTQNQIVGDYLDNVQISTDDGSQGFHGTVVDLLGNYLKNNKISRAKIFACGPNIMLRNLSELARQYGIPCEVSLETSMACGIGICQGCPVERNGGDKKYALVCKEGPVFNAETIRI